MEIVSFARFGYAGEIIKVEADLRRGIPAITIVGLPDGAVREAMERMRAAIRNSGFEFPRERILINLSPADMKKEGSSFDLPIALAVLMASNDGEGPVSVSAAGTAGAERVMVLGELELSGAVRPVRGMLSAVARGIGEGIRHYIVPEENRAEAEIQDGVRIIGVSSLAEAMGRIRTLEAGDDPTSRTPAHAEPAPRTARSGPTPENPARRTAPEPVSWPAIDAAREGFEDVKGQARLVRALEIAAAGGHSLIAYGPPGCGKTLAIRRFPALLPDLDRETAVTVTRIHGIVGRNGAQSDDGPLIRRPPFREPHQNTSLEGMTGGGKNCLPGEVSLAHGGALFLDEATLFRTSVLQSLRTPLETGSVTVSRAGRSNTFPSRFQLLMAVNPCPCGNFGASGKLCTCLPESVERYWKRLTAPLLDRVDLRVCLAEPAGISMTAESGFSTADLRAEITAARVLQRGRGTGLNANLAPADIDAVCALSPAVRRLLECGMEAARLSGRGAHSILKTARTIADLEGSEAIREEHVLEAMQFRRWTGMVPDFLED